VNIAERLTINAKNIPDKPAVKFPVRHKSHDQYEYAELTFKELETLSNKYARALQKHGLKKGDKTLLFLRPGLDFPAMTFALFKLGVVPVFIDPGMGKANLLKCIKEAAPVALISEAEIHYLKYFYRDAFRSIKMNVTTGKLTWGKMISLRKMKREKVQSFTPVNCDAHETAAILFTSGGTGTPKGVVYTHEIFMEQTNVLQSLFGLTANDVDMPGFPLFSLFTIAMGMTSCIPDMDPSKPGQCDPEKLVANINDCNPTFVAGSPAIWERVADYCVEKGITLPSVKYVVMFGAPVSTRLHLKFRALLPHGTTYTPYGATEALPVSCVSGEFILKHTAHLSEEGHGTCIGKPVPGVDIKIIRSTNAPIHQMSDDLLLPEGSIGEIIVRGKAVTREYFNLPEQTREAKIPDGNGTFWHRMGDVGHIDKSGLVWFCGRKSHQVFTKEEVLYPIAVEAIFNRHPAVKRSALVGLGSTGKQTPAIVIERKDGQYLSGKSRSIFESELLGMAKKYSHTKDIQKIYLSKNFPVDVRHNIKIDRLKLKEEIEQYEQN
jgi:acyl-CoA synthetase (AMP-forming)/AMP-acid ligase II